MTKERKTELKLLRRRFMLEGPHTWTVMFLRSVVAGVAELCLYIRWAVEDHRRKGGANRHNSNYAAEHAAACEGIRHDRADSA